MTDPLILGVDVGNSKTHIAVADLSGRVIAAAQGPGALDGYSQPTALVGLVRDRLAAVGLGGQRFEAATFAVAGLDLPEQDAAYEAGVAAADIAEHLCVLNDVFALMRTDARGGDGVAVICGAGINAVGVRGDARVRFHSFGETSGDWGGGIDVGRAALFEACRGEDGRQPPTLLSRSIARHFGLTTALEVSEAIVLDRLPRTRVVELAPLVFRAADEGDRAARLIVERLADEVALLVEATRRRLEWPEDEPMPVLLGGGILQSEEPRLLDRVRSSLGDGGRTRVTVASVPPVIGSVLLARDMLVPDREAQGESTTMAGSFRTLVNSGGRRS